MEGLLSDRVAMPALVRIEPTNYVSVRGEGDPTAPEFYSARSAVLALAEALDRVVYGSLGVNHNPPIVEALFWYEGVRAEPGIADFFGDGGQESHVSYRLMTRVGPRVITDHVLAAAESIGRERGIAPMPAAELFAYDEGISIQMVHRGSLSNLQDSMGQLAEFASAHGLARRGPHHELYPVPPVTGTARTSWATMLRIPVR